MFWGKFYDARHEANTPVKARQAVPLNKAGTRRKPRRFRRKGSPAAPSQEPRQGLLLWNNPFSGLVCNRKLPDIRPWPWWHVLWLLHLVQLFTCRMLSPDACCKNCRQGLWLESPCCWGQGSGVSIPLPGPSCCSVRGVLWGDDPLQW